MFQNLFFDFCRAHAENGKIKRTKRAVNDAEETPSEIDENYHIVNSDVLARLLSLSKALDAIKVHMNNLTKVQHTDNGAEPNHLRKKRETVNHIEAVIQVMLQTKYFKFNK